MREILVRISMRRGFCRLGLSSMMPSNGLSRASVKRNLKEVSMQHMHGLRRDNVLAPPPGFSHRI